MPILSLCRILKGRGLKTRAAQHSLPYQSDHRSPFPERTPYCQKRHPIPSRIYAIRIRVRRKEIASNRSEASAADPRSVSVDPEFNERMILSMSRWESCVSE